ncbi:MAG: apolipoprotein N-acyltransferase [Elusimicrobia bacterium]|nr:apolipoprotein N-acyltransferase [Elusimicrobiota bacterium]
MNTFKNISLTLISAVLLALSFPAFSFFYLAWFALIPLTFVVLNNNLKPLKVFSYAFFCGFAFYAMTMYWILLMLKYNTGSWVQSFFAAGLLWGYLALYFGVWGLLLNTAKKHFNSPVMLVLVGAGLWAVLEYARTYLLTGFPWNLLAYSQHKFLSFIQIAEFFGVYVISFAIVFANLMLYTAIKQKKAMYGIIAVALVVFISVFGSTRLNYFHPRFGDNIISVSVVQANIDQNRKWDERYRYEIIATLHMLARTVSRQSPNLVIWPETALPDFIPGGRGMVDLAKELALTTGGLNIISAIYDGERPRFYNSVFALHANDGVFERIHSKTHLVPFGEYVPFREHLSRHFEVLNTLGDFSHGNSITPFSHGHITLGSTVCSENFFPDISRRLARAGAQIIINQKNNAWFFDTAAPRQHFPMNVFRAIETRKPVIISANTGISAAIDPAGRILYATDVEVQSWFNIRVFQNSYQSFYVKNGDIFIFLWIALLIIAAFKILIKNLLNRKLRSQGEQDA